MSTHAIGIIQNADAVRRDVDIPAVAVVLGAAGIGAYVGFQFGGPYGAAVGALVAAFIAGFAMGFVRSIRVVWHADGRVEVKVKTVF